MNNRADQLATMVKGRTTNGPFINPPPVGGFRTNPFFVIESNDRTRSTLDPFPPTRIGYNEAIAVTKITITATP